MTQEVQGGGGVRKLEHLYSVLRGVIFFGTFKAEKHALTDSTSDLVLYKGFFPQKKELAHILLFHIPFNFTPIQLTSFSPAI